MVDSENGSQMPSDIATASRWRWWNRDAEWRSKVDRKLAEFALGLTPDSGGIKVWNGLGWKEMLAGGGLLAAVIAGMTLLNQRKIAPEPTTPPVSSSPADAGYEVRFYDAEGNQIQLDRWPGETETPGQD